MVLPPYDAGIELISQLNKLFVADLSVGLASRHRVQQLVRQLHAQLTQQTGQLLLRLAGLGLLLLLVGQAFRISAICSLKFLFSIVISSGFCQR